MGEYGEMMWNALFHFISLYISLFIQISQMFCSGIGEIERSCARSSGSTGMALRDRNYWNKFIPEGSK
jgi:hypothetical protein